MQPPHRLAHMHTKTRTPPSRTVDPIITKPNTYRLEPRAQQQTQLTPPPTLCPLPPLTPELATTAPVCPHTKIDRPHAPHEKTTQQLGAAPTSTTPPTPQELQEPKNSPKYPSRRTTCKTHIGGAKRPPTEKKKTRIQA